MHSDFGLGKDALSYDKSSFSFQVNKKKLNLKKPQTPPWAFFFPIKFNLFLKLLMNKISGTPIPSVLKKVIK